MRIIPYSLVAVLLCAQGASPAPVEPTPITIAGSLKYRVIWAGRRGGPKYSLANAPVSLKIGGTTYRTTADPDGNYEFKNVPVRASTKILVTAQTDVSITPLKGKIEQEVGKEALKQKSLKLDIRLSVDEKRLLTQQISEMAQ